MLFGFGLIIYIILLTQKIKLAQLDPYLFDETMVLILFKFGRIASILMTISIIGVYIYEYLYYKFYYYNFTEEKAEIKKGVVSQATGHVYYQRLQNIYVDQDALDRIFGLYDIHYETAGEKSGFYSHVDGLNKENAEKLITFLNQKAKTAYPPSLELPKILESPPKTEGQGIATTKYIELTRNECPISEKIVYIDGVIGWISGFILFTLFVGGGFANLSAYFVSVIWIVGFIGSGIISFLLRWIWYKNFYFKMSAEKGEIRSRVISQSISYLYYDRIQNVNVDQNFIYRLFDLYSISIETAGETTSRRLVIPGLNKEGAEKLRDFLLNKARFCKEKL